MLPRSWIDALFQRFEALYGNSFHKKWDGTDIENVKRVWAEVLATLTGEQIKAGLDECSHSCNHPPSAPEFYSICKTKTIAAHKPAMLEKKREEISPENKAKLDEIKRQLAARMIVNAEDDARHQGGHMDNATAV